jgi:hypothetical protein
LTDDGAEGIRPPTLKGFVLLWFPCSNGKVAVQEPKSPVFPLLLDSIMVPAQQLEVTL